MAGLNKKVPNRSGSTPLTTVGTSTTYEGGKAFVSDAESECYRLGANLIGNDKDSFYESGQSRDDRFTTLISQIAVDNPTWVAGYLPWLRNEGIRTASLMGAASAVHSRLSNPHDVVDDELLSSLGHMGINRYLANQVCMRADEPAELAQHYISAYGKLPKAFKRGLSDAANRLWNPYSVMKYDTASHEMRFADLVNLAHIAPANPSDMFDRMPTWKLEEMSEGDVMAYSLSSLLEKKKLFEHIINRRFGNDEVLSSLPDMIKNNTLLRKEVANGNYKLLLNPEVLRAAGMTWEDALSLAGNKVPKDKLWNALILGGMVPIFATLRNLRNFDEAGISQQAVEYVQAQLSNPEVIRKSRIFPFRFLTAIEQLNSYTWHSSLETAVQLSVSNIPEMPGNTAVLVDLSASMQSPVSAHSKTTLAMKAASFGAAIAVRNQGHVKLVAFASYDKAIPVPAGSSILKIAQDMNAISRASSLGGGTETANAIRNHVDSTYRRVITCSDGQSFPANTWGYGSYASNYGKSLRDLVDPKVHMYGLDLAGYKTTDIQSGGHDRTHQLASPSDSTFKWIPIVEAGIEARWPWLGQ